MIESNQDIIKIYSNTDTTKLKIFIVLLILECICGTYMYFTVHAYNNIFLIINFFMILFIFIALKNIKKKKVQVLEAEITKEGIKIYTKKQVLEYKYKDLKNVSCYNGSNSSKNEIFINYYDINQKQKTKIFRLTGCYNEKFIDLVNSIKQTDKEDLNIISDNNTIESIENINKKEDLYENLVAGKTLNVLFLGKDRLIKKISENNYTLPRTSKFYFIDEKGNELYLYLHEMDILYNKLKIKEIYTIEYNKKSKNFIVKYTEDKFNKEIFENVKNRLEYKYTLLFDDIIIQKEIEYEQTRYKLICINRYILLLDLLLLLKYPKISIIIFFITLILNLIFLVTIRNKCKNYYNNF